MLSRTPFVTTSPREAGARGERVARQRIPVREWDRTGVLDGGELQRFLMLLPRVMTVDGLWCRLRAALGGANSVNSDAQNLIAPSQY